MVESERSVSETREDVTARRLLDQYLLRLTALARSKLSPEIRRRLDPEDVVMSAFRSFFVGGREGRWSVSEGDDPWSLLAMLTLRKLSRQVRRHRAARRSVQREEDLSVDWIPTDRSQPSAEDAAILSEELERLIATTDGLDHEVLVRQLRGQDVAAIAADLEISDRTVRRAQQRVRELITSDQSHARRSAIDVSEALKSHHGDRLTPTRSLDEFLLHEMVGQGSFCKVFRATDRRQQCNVAVKFLRKGAWSDARSVHTLIQEYEVLSQLRHRHLLVVEGWGRTARGAVFLVSEWIDGGDLSEWVSRRRPESDIVRVGYQLACALQLAHAQSIFHCDLKPANVLLDQAGDCRLADFGLARWGADDETSMGGTIGFAAPEQLHSAFGEVDARTDVYGLGSLLYALLDGYPPCLGNDLPQSISRIFSPERAVDLESLGISAELSRVVMSALNKSPNERWPNMEVFATVLKNQLSSYEGEKRP